MKKRIIFMVINMNIGGTEKALLNMLAEIPQEQFEITVLMLEKKGGFLHAIPDGIHLKYLQDYKSIKNELNGPPVQIILDKMRSGKVVKSCVFASLHLLSKITKERSLFYKYMLKDIPSPVDEYDIAVAYAGPMDFISYFVANKINAKRKIQWIHFDIHKICFNKQFAAKVYQTFDQLYVVSNEGKEKLAQTLPAISYKTDVFTNLISPKMIHKEAQKGTGFQDDFNGMRILTVGRLTKEKGQDIAINVLSKLIHHGYDVKWYCLGEGSERQAYEKMVAELRMEDHFIFLGVVANPYHYMTDCDLYVQPSRHEGYCITLAEARVLRKPIITTNFTGAKEQIADGKTGLIVEVNEDQIYEAIKKLIKQPRLCNVFRENLAKEVFGNTTDMDKILQPV